MSPIGRALTDRFTEVCRLELIRLQRKTASLSQADRRQVEALCEEITRGISAHIAAAAECRPDAFVHDILGRLFAVVPGDQPRTTIESPARPSERAQPGEQP